MVISAYASSSTRSKGHCKILQFPVTPIKIIKEMKTHIIKLITSINCINFIDAKINLIS